SFLSPHLHCLQKNQNNRSNVNHVTTVHMKRKYNRYQRSMVFAMVCASAFVFLTRAENPFANAYGEDYEFCYQISGTETIDLFCVYIDPRTGASVTYTLVSDIAWLVSTFDVYCYAFTGEAGPGQASTTEPCIATFDTPDYYCPETPGPPVLNGGDT